MSSAYGKIDRPKEYNSSELEALLPIENTTKSNKLVSVHSLTTILQQFANHESAILSYLQSLLNTEIEAGNTYPQKFVLNSSEFKNYFLSGDAFIVLNGGKTTSKEFYNNLEENLLGTFYVKPNFPGRCSHVTSSSFFSHIIWFRLDLQWWIYCLQSSSKSRNRSNYGLSFYQNSSLVGLQSFHV